MGEIAIHVENSSTRYRVGPRERDKALRDIITDAFAAPFRCLHENSPFAIRHSRCLSGCLLPSAFWSPHASRFTFHVFRLSALRFPVSPCPLSSPVLRLLSAVSHLHSAIRNPKSTMEKVHSVNNVPQYLPPYLRAGGIGEGEGG